MIGAVRMFGRNKDFDIDYYTVVAVLGEALHNLRLLYGVYDEPAFVMSKTDHPYHEAVFGVWTVVDKFAREMSPDGDALFRNDVNVAAYNLEKDYMVGIGMGDE